MQRAATIVGALVLAGVLIGFVRSIWHSPRRTNGEGNAESMAGVPTTSNDHHHQDSGSQGGVDSGGN
jgi:hypothetical protein